MQVIRLTLAAREIDSPTIQLIDDGVYCLSIWISAKTYIERHHEQTFVIYTFFFQTSHFEMVHNFLLSFFRFFYRKKPHKIMNFFILTTEFPNCLIKKIEALTEYYY